MNKNISEDSYSPGYCEYLVPGFANRKIIALRIASLFFGMVLTALLFELMSFIPQVFAVWFVLICAFEVFVFRLTKREFEYTVALGEMTVEVIYGKRIRRKMFSVRLSDVDKVFAVKSFFDEKISKNSPDKTVYSSPKKSDHMYCLLVKDKTGNGFKTALVFSSCKKLNDSIKFYNRSCFHE